jgi:hypothetical protein
VRGAATRLGVVVISQGSTAHSLAFAGDNVLRFVPDDVREGEAVVALLRRDGVDAIVPVWRRDAGNAGLVRSVRRQFVAAGGKVSNGVPYATSMTTFNDVASSISAQADALSRGGATKVGFYLAAFDEVVDLFHAARSHSILQRAPWYGTTGLRPALASSTTDALRRSRMPPDIRTRRSAFPIAPQRRPSVARTGPKEARPRARRTCAERVRRPADRRRCAAARRRERRRKASARRCRRRERARRSYRQDDAQPRRRPGVRELRFLVGSAPFEGSSSGYATSNTLPAAPDRAGSSQRPAASGDCSRCVSESSNWRDADADDHGSRHRAVHRADG